MRKELWLPPLVAIAIILPFVALGVRHGAPLYASLLGGILAIFVVGLGRLLAWRQRDPARAQAPWITVWMCAGVLAMSLCSFVRHESWRTAAVMAGVAGTAAWACASWARTRPKTVSPAK